MKTKILTAIGLIIVIYLSRYSVDCTRKQIISCVENGGSPRQCEYEVRR